MANHLDNRRVYRLNKEQSEAWYDLGAPIYLPTLKFIISMVQYAIDNYFLIKNTYNALVLGEKEDSLPMDSSHPKIIAGCTIGLHIVSSIIISVIDSFNKDALSSSGSKPILKKKMKITIRMLAHLTLTMKLLRYVTVYIENMQRNAKIHERIQRRVQVTKEEIGFVVDQRKNSLVESHYDLIESFFKTVPAALLQVYFMFKSNPEAKLRLYSTADQDRFATVFFTIITAAISAANYQSDYLAYKKVLIFQECFKTNFKFNMNLKIPGDICFISSIPILILTIGTRVSFYCMLIFFGLTWFTSTVALLMFLGWLLGLYWTVTSWRLRPVLENPLFGTPWVCYDVIDLWIGLFIPGVHYQKFFDNFWNQCIMSVIGIIIITLYSNVLVEDDLELSTTFSPDEIPYNHSSITLQAYENSTTNGNDHEEVYFIGYVVKVLMKVHEILTFNQISYAKFFMHVIAKMNIMNLFSLIYICVLNGFGYIDLDFPVEISNEIYSKILKSFSISNSKVSNEAEPLIDQRRKQEECVVFSLLTNKQFFSVVTSSSRIGSVDLDEIRESLLSSEADALPEPPNTGIKWLVNKVINALEVTCFPSYFRVTVLNWDIPSDINSIKSSIENHSLEDLFCSKLIDSLYRENEEVDRDNKRSLNKCLAVFCSQYNDICKNMTSYRLLKFAEYFSVDLLQSRGPVVNALSINNDDDLQRRKFYEETYFKRIGKVYRNKHHINDDIDKVLF